MNRLAAALPLVLVLAGCSDSAAPDGAQGGASSSPHPALPSGTSAAIDVASALPPEVSPGFVYTEERVDRSPGVGVICLGDRLRIYHVSETWQPATVAVVGGDGQVLRSLRIDLPPSGTVRAELPEMASGQDLQVRLTTPAGAPLEALPATFQPRIGFDGPELTNDRLRELGLAEMASSTASEGGITLREERWSAATTATTSGLGPGPQIIVIGGIETHAVALPSRAVLRTDDEWLEKALPAIEEVMEAMDRAAEVGV
ncbi:MAG: hypothetical protein AAFX05_01760 [Planctomycetota bacterium]